MTHTHLSQILVKIKGALSESGEPRNPPLKTGRVLAVFDLDSTLFDVGPRFEKVLLDFSLQKEFSQQFGEFKDIFQNIKVIKGDWGLKDVVERAGRSHFQQNKIAEEKVMSFRRKLTEFWLEKFFTNEYLEFDVPYRGATHFVNQIYQAGAEVVYLTGRDQQRMGPGSEKVLSKWGFPLQAGRSELVLKPHKDIDDAEFKRDWFCNLQPANYSQIWFFENEPLNIHLIRKSCPHVEIVFFDSTHSKQANPPDDLLWIQNFCWDEEK